MAFTAKTANSAAAWRPDQFTFEPAVMLSDAAILNHSTAAGEIHGDEPVIRVAYVVDDDAEFVAEGEVIPEGEPALNEALIHTRKFAQLIRLSNEQYRQNGTDEELGRSVSRAMITKADKAFLSQVPPTGPAVAPVAGLINMAGVSQTAVAGNVDKLIDLEAIVRANGARPTAWVMAPDAWALLRKMKTATASNVGILGAGTDDSEPRLLSIPVQINAQMPSKTGLLVDRTAVLSATSGLTIATDASAYFSSDSIGVRATWRTGHVVPRPNRIGVFALTATYLVTLGSPSAGAFDLSFGGNTATIAYSPTAANVKSALAALDDGYTASDWTVTGSTGGPFTVTTPGGILTGSGAGLTGGTFAVTPV